MTRTPSTTIRRPLSVAARLVDVVLLAVIAIGLTSVVLGRVVPLLGHPVYVVAGPSMAPAIDMGSALVLDPVVPADLAVGDVVSLRSGPQQAIFTHRIVRLAERDGAIWLETRGDANPAPDPSIMPADAVIGRVAWTVPWAGYVLALLSTVPGLVLLLSTGAMLMLLGWWLDVLAADGRRGSSGAIPEIVAARPAAPSTGSVPATDLASPGRRRKRRAAIARSRT